MNVLQLFVMGMACWRLTSLLIAEKGPYNIFQRLREKLGITHYEDGKPCAYPDKFVCELFSCVWCLSVWISAGFVVSYIFLPQITFYFSLWLSLSTICILIDNGLN